MKITLLDAEFVGQVTGTPGQASGVSCMRQGAQIEGAQGLWFQCPVCAVGKEPGEEDGRRFVRGAHYVLCWFSNPRNAPPLDATWWPTIARWTMSGSSLDDLTLQPSILLKGGCNWHGYLTNGDAA